MTDKQFILAFDKWPKWPFLPIKRTVNHELNTACLISNESLKTGKPKIYKLNIWDLPRTPEGALDNKAIRTTEITTLKYESLDAMIADGWVVD